MKKRMEREEVTLYLLIFLICMVSMTFRNEGADRGMGERSNRISNFE